MKGYYLFTWRSLEVSFNCQEERKFKHQTLTIKFRTKREKIMKQKIWQKDNAKIDGFGGLCRQQHIICGAVRIQARRTPVFCTRWVVLFNPHYMRLAFLCQSVLLTFFKLHQQFTMSACLFMSNICVWQERPQKISCFYYLNQICALIFSKQNKMTVCTYSWTPGHIQNRWRLIAMCVW